ncbi:glycogen synthase kinase-3 (macronuclear) [Tetrahymena thermophila SB210]|uniref:Glycogen synthase kinase-3 n=1 Tax=Tetrahymena thermophila (strain SB210) TaxID=312017 RepID=Q248A1_TETTS|nr:glycogen synthase kinase-3 [Tetrahymena thermophila SB210]EAS04144.2 glycogen synthase kinase-3 [Tetrahymena thermophila SB210]|eukprot:XP_001024389.2 glycogen synthase kinase-3 [Tetrahymena thermophila SB210]
MKVNKNYMNMRIPTQNYDKEVLPTQADEGIGSRVHTVGSMKENEYQKKQQQKQQAGNYTYTIVGDEDKVVGSGTFGVVYQATTKETGEVVAIKKVFQDKRYKNRELQMMKEIGNHPNVIKLRNHYYSYGNSTDDVYLHLVMDFVPETLYKMIKYYSKKHKGNFPNILLKYYSYQMLRSLAYIHGINICHRDIKPQNILVDPRNHNLKMCDFGSAKKLVPGESNISYICSRCYRAPELMFQATQYTHAIDVWSVGCVIAEMVLGQPIFIGESSVDQLIEIIKVLGTPTQQQIFAMNPDHQGTKMPNIKPTPWTKVFQNCRIDPLAIDLISKILVYNPEKRLKPLEALLHPFFEELRNPKCRINGKPLDNLFNFTEAEIGPNEELLQRLIPDWYVQQLTEAQNQY